MAERKAVYYGQVQIIPGVMCDGYVLSDQTAVLSERGTADLLGLSHTALQNMATNWPPKTLESFIDKDLIMATDLKESVEVSAKNSPYLGRKITVCGSLLIEKLIRGYALASANHSLKPNQKHIGDRCVILVCSLIRTALDTAIKQACGFTPDIQEIAQKNYIDAVGILKEFGLKCSVSDEIATKKDIATFLNVPEGTLTTFLQKYHHDIKPIHLDYKTIKSLGSKAHRMFGYYIEDVVKIATGMDTEIGIDIKKRIFGDKIVSTNLQTKSEIDWRKSLARVFQGYEIKYHYPIGKYKVDYFVEKLMLVLECNGFAHVSYDPAKEAEREKFILERYALIRFHHNISWEAFTHALLNYKIGEVIYLYNKADILPK